MADNEIKQWDMTEEELGKGESILLQKAAIKDLLFFLLKAEKEALMAENKWWDEMIENHNIPALANVAGDVREGKIWIRGQVPELDKLVKS